MKEQVEAAVRALSHANPGSKPYLGKYQQGLGQVVEGLDTEEIEQMQQKKRQWENEGCPPEIQAR